MDKTLNFQFRKLTFIKTDSEELNQLENTTLMRAIFNEYKQVFPLKKALSKTQYGFTASAQKSGNCRLLRITDIKEDGINWATVPFCDCGEIEKYGLDEKDILIARTGGTTGKTTLIQNIKENSVFASYLIRLSVAQNYNPEYIYLFLNSYLFWNQILELKNGTAQPNVNAVKMTTILFPSCPKEIQDEIVEYKKNKVITNSVLKQAESDFQNINLVHQNLKLILSENENQVNIVSQLKQAILQEAIAGQLTAEWRTENPMQKGNPDTDAAALLAKIKTEKQQLIADGKLKKEKPLAEIAIDEIPFSIPDSWVWCRLGALCSIVRGGSPRPAGDKKYYEGDIPFLKVADLTRFETIFLNDYTYTIKEAGLYKTRFVEANTLMLTNSGATLGVPKICTFPTTFNDGIAAFLGLLDEFDKVFLYYFLKSKTKWFLSEAARGQGQPNLNTDIIGNTLIAIPPLAEQKAIVEKVDRLMNIIDQLEQQIKHRKQLAEDLMQTVLREAFE
jgi:type I restriction enzyme S subunit